MIGGSLADSLLGAFAQRRLRVSHYDSFRAWRAELNGGGFSGSRRNEQAGNDRAPVPLAATLGNRRECGGRRPSGPLLAQTNAAQRAVPEGRRSGSRRSMGGCGSAGCLTRVAG